MIESGKQYQEALRSFFDKNFPAAWRAISIFGKHFPEQLSSAVCLKAHCLFREGKREKAFELLSDMLNSDADEYCRCRVTRSSLALVDGNFALALEDYNAILADTTPHIVAGFHSSVRFFKCFILANQADNQFEFEICHLKPDAKVWIRGEMRDVENLKRIFRDRAGKAVKDIQNLRIFEIISCKSKHLAQSFYWKGQGRHSARAFFDAFQHPFRLI